MKWIPTVTLLLIVLIGCSRHQPRVGDIYESILTQHRYKIGAIETGAEVKKDGLFDIPAKDTLLLKSQFAVLEGGEVQDMQVELVSSLEREFDYKLIKEASY